MKTIAMPWARRPYLTTQPFLEMGEKKLVHVSESRGSLNFESDQFNLVYELPRVSYHVTYLKPLSACELLP